MGELGRVVQVLLVGDALATQKALRAQPGRDDGIQGDGATPGPKGLGMATMPASAKREVSKPSSAGSTKAMAMRTSSGPMYSSTWCVWPT